MPKTKAELIGEGDSLHEREPRPGVLAEHAETMAAWKADTSLVCEASTAWIILSLRV